jgi:hypothetical protein
MALMYPMKLGHPVQRDLGDVELVLADELEQQVERAGEVDQLHREPGRSLGDVDR